MNGTVIEDYFDRDRLESARSQIENGRASRLLVIGVGAALLCTNPGLIVYADLARWEIQQRWRRKESGNFGLDNADDATGSKYKCGYFVEWRAADRLKKCLLPRLDFLLDTNDAASPKMISGDTFRRALRSVSQNAVPRGALFRSRTMGRSLDGRDLRPSARPPQPCLVF